MTTKRTLLTSVVSLVLCFCMLLGTTFAWFTDAVISGGNIIASGNLDAKMHWSDKLLEANSDEWQDADGNPIFTYNNWEPGYTEVRYVKVSNAGSLNFRWNLTIEADGEVTDLADVIDVYYVNPVTNEFTKDNIKGLTSVGTLTDVLENKTGLDGRQLTPDSSVILAIAFHMDELAGNDYQGKSLCEAGFSLKLIATQDIGESDSFGDDYDADAEWPYDGIRYQVTTSIANKVDETDKLTEAVDMGNADDDIYAQIPAGVKLAEGANALTLKVEAVTDSQSGVTSTHRSEVVRSVDVHIDGVAEDNTIPMVITLNGLLPAGLNSNNVKLYHVENSATNEMTLVDNPVNHNEFSYDPLTGDAVITIASFSEIVVYGETAAYWNGETATAFAGGTGTEADPYLIANAAQLAYFRDEVDNGRTFEIVNDGIVTKQYVKLTKNINLQGKNEETGEIYENNFDPIGFGYDYDGFMKNGKTFNGIFDGDNHIIFGLYQNGWDLDSDKTNYSTYTYSMAGGGLFASVVDATIKNLTMSGADIVFECVDMGVVVGYAQGNCTFDNIAIVNCTIQNYNRYTGGVVGECSPRYDADGTPMYSNHLFNNIRVDSTTTISSLWGSFDTSLGGILGGKWDKYGAETKVKMTNCDVACKIDAFNDVTSAYQWYAYRRAGMLIGNTEQSANNKALADFLTCENVHVYYGEWNNFHYCEFENQSDAEGNSSSWNRYPWVRVESGLSCSAYSNPRYGHPIVNGTAIVDSIHSHNGDDQCMVSLPFHQLYGGGQGVYGATDHTGVSEGAYTVTYINYGETIKVEFVSDNSNKHTLWDATEYNYGETYAAAWVDGNGKEVSSILAGNVMNYIVYPKFAGEYTIRFFDAENNVVYFETFKEKQAHTLDSNAIEEARLAIQNKVDASAKVIVVSWDRTNLNTISKSEATKDITVKAVYKLSTSSITLTPVEENGVIVSYKVTDANKTVENVLISIPPYVGTIPVEELSDSAFAGFDNLHAVTIPKTINYIGANALASTWNNGTFGSDKGEEMTLYYAGSYQEWLNDVTLADGWSNGVSAGTRLFFLNGTDSVDFNEGYLQFVVDDSNWLGAVKAGHFEYVDTVPESFVSKYYTNCDCDVNGCKGNLRPDAKYWAAYVN